MQQQELEQCDNCLKMLPSTKISTHFGYCRRNVKKCNDCGNMFDINFPQEHQEEFHKKESCNFCNQAFSSAQISKHKINCTKKPQFCQYCQQNIPTSQYNIHVRQCQSRTKICQRCGKDVVNKDYFVHITTCQGPQDQVIQIPHPKNYTQHIKNQRQKFEEKKGGLSNKPSQMKKNNQVIKKEQKPMERMMSRINKKQVQKKDQSKNGYNLRKKQGPANNNSKESSYSYSYSYSQKNNQAPVVNVHEEQFEYDPRQFENDHFGDYSNNNYNNNYLNNHDMDGEDPELQQVLMMSMGVQQNNNLPNNFNGMDMNASFYRDLQLQDAYEQQLKKSSKKR